VKRTVRIVAVVLAIFVVVLIALPFLIDVNRFRPEIEAKLSSALGREVTVGKLGLSLLSGSVRADNIAIADDPKFETQPFITAKALKVGVELVPLVFSKRLMVTGIALDQPEITLLKAANGVWNFSSLGGPAAPQAPAAEKPGGSTPQNLSVGKLEIKDGKLIVGKANSPAKPQVYDKVNIKVSNFSFTSQFPFTVAVELPGGGDANLTGKAGPIAPDDASRTPFEATVKVHNLDIAASGFIDPASGIAGMGNFDGTLNSDGRKAQAGGVLVGRNLKFSPKASPAPKTVTVQYAVDLDLDRQVGTITQGDVAIGSAQAHLTGTFQTQGDTQTLDLKLTAPGMPVDELETMLPAFAVVLPSGSQLKGGTLSIDVTIVGPIDKLVIAGPVRLAGSELVGFNLGQKLGMLSTFAGKALSNPNTSIQNFSVSARVTPDGTRADDINLTAPAIGVITGAGTVSPAGALDFHMVANLKGGAVGAATKVAAWADGKGGIPFSVAGTASNPQFAPDLKGMTGGIAKGALGQVLGGVKGASGSSPLSGLSGLFGGKKKK
jgi:AsmA protein